MEYWNATWAVVALLWTCALIGSKGEGRPGTPRKKMAKDVWCPQGSSLGQAVSHCPHVYLLSEGMTPPQAHARP